MVQNGSIIEGIERECRPMQVFEIDSAGRVYAEWWGEFGRQTVIFPAKSEGSLYREVSGKQVAEFAESKQRWSESVRKNREYQKHLAERRLARLHKPKQAQQD